VPLAVVAAGREAPILVVRGPDDAVIARVPLPDARFTLRYRNSLYGSLAEERYVATDDRRIVLDGLAADELAVLEEYYGIDEPARRSTAGDRAWVAEPARPVVVPDLTIAATDLGRRTLLVEGHEPIELWRVVDDASPSVELEVARP